MTIFSCKKTCAFKKAAVLIKKIIYLIKTKHLHLRFNVHKLKKQNSLPLILSKQSPYTLKKHNNLVIALLIWRDYHLSLHKPTEHWLDMFYFQPHQFNHWTFITINLFLLLIIEISQSQSQIHALNHSLPGN